MKIEEITHRLGEKEKIEVVKITKDGEKKFYSYNYFVRSEDDWKLHVRWDNFQNQPHVDTYDENENLIESSPSREKTLKEVRELVDIFGKNLVTMDISKL